MAVHELTLHGQAMRRVRTHQLVLSLADLMQHPCPSLPCMVTHKCLDDISWEEYVSNTMLTWTHHVIKHLPGRTWSSHTHVFIPVHLKPPEIGCRHWVGFVLSLRTSRASCYDPLKVSQAAVPMLALNCWLSTALAAAVANHAGWIKGI